ncbi:cold shock domain-containing protein [Pseudoxanthomonas sp.]|jgi:Cold shock proteins|uniref:cold shock domain-containing protein n=1 Tax=Pseudoxanthomonas sp. TaxID=1871049 RepID=UPI002FE282A1
MHDRGMLKTWNDERGFGFIEVSGTGEEIFVHISEFPRGVRPQVGEFVSFTTVIKNGKQRAVGVGLPGRPSRQSSHASREAASAGSVFVFLVPLVVVSVVGIAAYQVIGALYWEMNPAAKARRDLATDAATGREPAFRCDQRKHCSQMRSCAEAVYFLDHCPGVMMDGDNDRKPCEEQLCL